MKTNEIKSIEFINISDTLSELSMKEILGGRSVGTYMGCGNHHDGTEAASRLMALV